MSFEIVAAPPTDASEVNRDLREELINLKKLDGELKLMQNIDDRQKLTNLTERRNNIWNTIVKHDKLPKEIGKMHQDYENTVKNAHEETDRRRRRELSFAAKKLREEINKKLAEIL